MNRRSFFLLFLPKEKKSLESRLRVLEHRMDRAMELLKTEFRPPESTREMPAVINEHERKLEELEMRLDVLEGRS